MVHSLSDYFLSIGFLASNVDTSLFILFMSIDIFYFLIYVDDIFLTVNNLVLLHHLIRLLSSEFKLWDLGVAYYFTLLACSSNISIFLTNSIG